MIFDRRLKEEEPGRFRRGAFKKPARGAGTRRAGNLHRPRTLPPVAGGLETSRRHVHFRRWREPKAPASRSHSKRFAKFQDAKHCATAFGVRGACSRFCRWFMESLDLQSWTRIGAMNRAAVVARASRLCVSVSVRTRETPVPRPRSWKEEHSENVPLLPSHPPSARGEGVWRVTGSARTVFPAVA